MLMIFSLAWRSNEGGGMEGPWWRSHCSKARDSATGTLLAKLLDIQCVQAFVFVCVCAHVCADVCVFACLCGCV
jgi:hypothetical protein